MKTPALCANALKMSISPEATPTYVPNVGTSESRSIIAHIATAPNKLPPRFLSGRPTVRRFRRSDDGPSSQVKILKQTLAMIGILLLVLFLILVGKAILETIWGLCFIAAGIFWHVVGRLLDVLIFFERRRKTAVLCVVGICAATGISYAQTSDTPKAEVAATAANVMPVGRTMTSADGRTIEVVIVAKTATGIKAKKSDGKEFEIDLGKLSDADRAFVATLVEPPVKKPKLLFIGGHEGAGPKHTELIVGKLTSAGFDVRVETSVGGKDANGIPTRTWPRIDKLSDQEIKDYDVIWEDAGPRKRLLTLVSTYQGIIVMHASSSVSLKDFLADQTGGKINNTPFVAVNKNLIRYSYREVKWTSKETAVGPVQPEFIDQAIAEVQKLLSK